MTTYFGCNSLTEFVCLDMCSTILKKILLVLLVLAFWQDSNWYSGSEANLSADNIYVSQCIDSTDLPDFSLTPQKNITVFDITCLSLPRSVHPGILKNKKTAVLPPPYLFLPYPHRKAVLNLQLLCCFSLPSDDPHPFAV